MADNINVRSGFFTAKVAALQRNEGDSDAADLVMYQRMLPQYLVDGVPTDISPSAPLPVAEYRPGKKPIHTFLQSVTGASKNLTANYADAADVAKMEADAAMRIDEVVVHAVNTGATEFEPLKYAGVELSTGLTLQAVQSTTVDLTDGVKVMSFLDWERFGATVMYTEHSSGLVATAALSFPSGLRLTSGQSIQVDMADDLSSLSQHYILIRGWYE
jgi:hypothetical protein